MAEITEMGFTFLGYIFIGVGIGAWCTRDEPSPRGAMWMSFWLAAVFLLISKFVAG